MTTAATSGSSLAELLPGRLVRLQRSTGLPVVFGGAVQGGRDLVITRAVGVIGTSLRGLAVQAGHGLGGAVLRDRTARRVGEYASTRSITHDYDRVVVHEEHLTAVLAVPVCVGGQVRAVLYGAARDRLPLGDRPLSGAVAVARQLERELAGAEAELRDLELTPTARAIAELQTLLAFSDDPDVRRRVARAVEHLQAGPGPVPDRPGVAVKRRVSLAPRELQALRLVATGARNVEVAAELGLGQETVKAYLRSAMRKLDVGNRTAAVHAARRSGLL